MVGEFAGERAEIEARVSPAAQASSFHAERDDDWQIEPPASSFSEAGEHSFWDSEPRYSISDLPSLLPAPVPAPQPAQPWRMWAARLLFATIVCTIVVLLALEIKALTQRGGGSLSDESMLATLAEHVPSRR
jgi:hypothetical protein